MKLVIAIDESKVALTQLQKFVHNNFPSCQVMAITNPIEGIDVIKKHRAEVDLIIIDYNLKEMNALDAVNQFRKFVELSKVVICSASTQKVLIDRAVEKGLKFMEKPLTQEKIDLLTLPLRHKAS